jgi:hypothetical protein
MLFTLDTKIELTRLRKCDKGLRRPWKTASDLPVARSWLDKSDRSRGPLKVVDMQSGQLHLKIAVSVVRSRPWAPFSINELDSFADKWMGTTITIQVSEEGGKVSELKGRLLRIVDSDVLFVDRTTGLRSLLPRSKIKMIKETPNA